MFLFILESIGTSELVLIAMVALIVFGPRKLPQMAKTIGKAMAEFRNATSEFKSTWEKEVSFEENGEKIITPPIAENQISRIASPNQPETLSQSEDRFPQPAIRELSASDTAEKFHNENNIKQPANEAVAEKAIPDKRDWL